MWYQQHHVHTDSELTLSSCTCRDGCPSLKWTLNPSFISRTSAIVVGTPDKLLPSSCSIQSLSLFPLFPHCRTGNIHLQNSHAFSRYGHHSTTRLCRCYFSEEIRRWHHFIQWCVMILWFVCCFCLVNCCLLCTETQPASPAVRKPLRETPAGAHQLCVVKK